MKKEICSLLIIFISTVIMASETQNVKSKVTSVTVFTNMAQIEREADINLKKGNNEITLSYLPGNLVEESVQIKGNGTSRVTIIDVKTEDYYDNLQTESRQKRFQKSLDSLSVLNKQVEDELSVLNSKEIFLDGLRNELPRSKEANGQKMSPKEWLDMLSFLETNTRQVLESIRIQTTKKEKIENEMQLITYNRNDFSQTGNKRFKQVLVTLNAEESTVFKLKMTYLAYEVSWKPVYDARVNSVNKKLNLVSYGLVKQNTGEDWDNVSVTLSTAQPAMQTSIPNLEPEVVGNSDFRKIKGGRSSDVNYLESLGSVDMAIKYINDYSSTSKTGSITGRVSDSKTGESLALANVIVNGTQYGAATDVNGNYFIKNIPPGIYSIKFRYLGFGDKRIENVSVKAGKSSVLDARLNSSDQELAEEIVVVAERPLLNQGYNSENESASVIDEFINVSYQVKSKQDIPSDNFEHKFQIASSDYDLKFDFYTVPKVTEKTFLLGKFVNTSDSPVIEGDVNIFVDQNYITHSKLPFIAPKDTSKLSLGTEELIQVSRKLIKKYAESKGFLSAKSKVSYEYEITLKNFRQTEETITVKDQAPISWSENTKVTLSKPTALESEIDDQNLITWKITLKPGESKKLNLTFEVVQ